MTKKRKIESTGFGLSALKMIAVTIGLIIERVRGDDSVDPVCKPDSVDSPINLKFPMSYVNFEIDFKFKTINQLELIKVGPNHLKIMADFGSVYYQNIEYRIYDAHFKYPSEHRINGIRYALELQVSTVSLEGAQFIVDVLFERNDFMPLQALSNYGFDNEHVKKMPTLDKDAKKCRLDLFGAFTMNDFLKDQKEFFLYEGSNINGDCKTSLHLVVSEPLWVSEEQLSIFKEEQEPVYKTKRYSNAVIYQNFVKKNDFKLHNVTSSRRDLPNGPTPGPYSHLPFLFQPKEGKPLGFLSKDFLPVWNGIPGGVDIIDPEVEPKRHGNTKFIKIGYRPFKMPGLKRPFYLAQFLMVSKHFKLPNRGAPRSIPIFVRANYLTKGKYPPIVKIRMPLISEGKNLSDLAKNATDGPSIACKKWWLHVTLNRNFQHELQYKNISDAIDKLAGVRRCADYFLLPNKRKGMNDFGSSKDFGTNNVTINNTGAGGANVICKTHLHILLNRESDPNLGDYVYQGCFEKHHKAIVGKKFGIGKLASFAQTGQKEVYGDEKRKIVIDKGRERRIEEKLEQFGYLVKNQELNHLKGQIIIQPD